MHSLAVVVGGNSSCITRRDGSLEVVIVVVVVTKMRKLYILCVNLPLSLTHTHTHTHTHTRVTDRLLTSHQHIIKNDDLHMHTRIRTQT